MDFRDPDLVGDTGLPWNQQLLIATERPTGQRAVDLATDEERRLREEAVDAVDRARTLGLIRDIANNVTAVVNLVASTLRGIRASQDASDRADTALALLQSQYGRDASEALGAAAIRQARAMIQNARTKDDIAAAAVLLRRVQAVQDAEKLSRDSAPGVSGTDVALFAVGVLAVGWALWRYSRSTGRRQVR